MLQQKAPIQTTTNPGDLHAQIAAMVAAAQGAPMPAQAPQMPMPQEAAPPPMQSMAGPAPGGGTQAPAMPQAGGSPQNIQKAMLAKAIRGS